MKKPKAKVVGENGNVFNTLNICTRALKKAGLSNLADKMQNEVFEAKTYNEAIQVMSNYCELV